MFDDVTYEMILPLGWAGSIFLAQNESHIYPNMCAKFGCGPTVVSKKKKTADRQRKLQLYIVDSNNIILNCIVRSFAGGHLEYLKLLKGTRVASTGFRKYRVK